MKEIDICPKCGSRMSPEGSQFGSKWFECKCGYKYHLHDEHIDPCECEDCVKKRKHV